MKSKSKKHKIEIVNYYSYENCTKKIRENQLSWQKNISVQDYNKDIPVKLV